VDTYIYLFIYIYTHRHTHTHTYLGVPVPEGGSDGNGGKVDRHITPGLGERDGAADA
jgi:hypothetical protein